MDIAYAPFIERFQPFLLEVKNFDITDSRPKLGVWIEVQQTLFALYLRTTWSNPFISSQGLCHSYESYFIYTMYWGHQNVMKLLKYIYENFVGSISI